MISWDSAGTDLSVLLNLSPRASLVYTTCLWGTNLFFFYRKKSCLVFLNSVWTTMIFCTSHEANVSPRPHWSWSVFATVWPTTMLRFDTFIEFFSPPSLLVSPCFISLACRQCLRSNEHVSQMAEWLRNRASNQKVAGSIPLHFTLLASRGMSLYLLCRSG